MSLRARHIHPGGWIEVPGSGTGRIRALYVVPGTTRFTVTLESGESFTLAWDQPVRFWSS